MSDIQTTTTNTTFFIYNENGTCIYIKEPSPSLFDSSFKGIIQALFYTSNEIGFSTNQISTDIGTLSYRKYSYNSESILLCLIYPHDYSSNTQSTIVIDNLLDIIYNSLLIHIGYNDLYKSSTPNDLDKIKKFLDIYSKTIDYLLYTQDLMLIFICEPRCDITREGLVNIKAYFSFSSLSNHDFLYCFTYDDMVFWNNKDWVLVDNIDRVCINIISKVYCHELNSFLEIPIYIKYNSDKDNKDNANTNTSKGNISVYKLILIRLTSRIKLILITETTFKLDIILDYLLTLDSFFLERLNQISITTSIENETITKLSTSFLVLNNANKSFKVLFDITKKEIFLKIIKNISFSSNSIKILSSLAVDNVKTDFIDEYYVKGDDFIFYFLQIQNLFLFFLFPSHVLLSQINEVKRNVILLKGDGFSNSN